MEFNLIGFREVCARSGFTKKELARIYGVTRQTIYDWSREHYAPTQLSLAERAAKATSALTAGLEKRVIPFDPTLAADKRQARIDIIIKTILDALKPSRP